MEKVYYRVIHTGDSKGHLSDLNFTTYDEALSKLDSFNSGCSEEYQDYWDKVRSEAKVVKVTELVEEI